MSKEDTKYARFGRAVADMLARTEDWGGDGSRHALNRIAELADEHGIDLSWKSGDDD